MSDAKKVFFFFFLFCFYFRSFMQYILNIIYILFLSRCCRRNVCAVQALYRYFSFLKVGLAFNIVVENIIFA